MDAPGRLQELGAAGRAAWNESLAARLAEHLPEIGSVSLLPEPDVRTPHRTGPDWVGLPPRAVRCLGREPALRVLDRDRRLHEEYVEWRTVRRPNGAIARVELTTELRDYWRVLAAHRPERTLDLVGELTGASVSGRRVYGVADPSALPPGERERRFVRTMIERPSPLNDGRDGICFMTHHSNDLSALVALAVAATVRCTVRDGRSSRCATADEAIALFRKAAVSRRASDPVIVERLGRLAYERRLVAFADPLGVYIQSVERQRLRTGGGEPVPRDWFRFGRGRGPGLHQRLVLEIPRGEEIVDVATERPVRHGGQVAELVQLRLFLSASEPGVAPRGAGLEAKPVRRRRDDCAWIRRIAAEA